MFLSTLDQSNFVVNSWITQDFLLLNLIYLPDLMHFSGKTFYWRYTATQSFLIHTYSIIAWGQGHRNGFLKLAHKDILLDFLSKWKMTVQLEKAPLWVPTKAKKTWRFFTRSAVFIETSQNMHLLKFKWHFVMFEYYHIPKNLKSLQQS